MPDTLVDVSPEMLNQWLKDGQTALIDVREDFEHAAEWIEGDHHFAMSKLDNDAVRRSYGDKRVVFYCRTGRRSAQAARAYANGDRHVFHLAGGIEGWKAAGRPTRRSAAAPRVDVIRQVQMISATLVLVGVALGLTVSPWFLGLCAFVAAGQFLAGATGWCGMAKLLAQMPWNRRPA